MSVKIIYQDIAPGAAEDAAVTAVTPQSWTDSDQLPDGSGDQSAIASLEHNLWLLNGSYSIKDAQTPAFWSAEMSDQNGDFANAPEITITFTEQYTSLGIYLLFDAASGNYCDDVTITWYQGSTQLATGDFTPDSTGYFCEQTVEAYNKVVITLNGTHLPYRYAKLSQIVFGVVREFDIDELRAVHTVQQVNLISAEVAINTLDFTLDSSEDIDYMFQLKQPVYAYNGTVLIGVFYIDGSSRSGPSLYDVSCIDALGVLDDSTFAAAIFSGKNAKTLLEEIIDGDFALDMDSSLQSATVTGLIPDCTRREAIQQVCFAIGAAVDTSGTDAIRVFAPASTGAAIIPEERIYLGGSVSTDAIVTAVRVTSHSYSTTASSGASQVDVGGVTYYDTTAVTEITNPNVTATDKQNIVEVTDATLVSPSNVAAVAQAVYNYYTRRSRQSTRIVVDEELPGDYVTVITPWETDLTGHITSMDLALSTIAAANCEILEG